MFLHSRILCSSSSWTDPIPDIRMVEAEVEIEIGVAAEIGVEVEVGAEKEEVEAEVRVEPGKEEVGGEERITGDSPHIKDLTQEKEGTILKGMMLEVEVRLLRRRIQVISFSLSVSCYFR
jgi:hypothetical protein